MTIARIKPLDNSDVVNVWLSIILLACLPVSAHYISEGHNRYLNLTPACPLDICKCSCEDKYKVNCDFGNVVLYIRSRFMVIECRTSNNEFKNLPTSVDVSDVFYLEINKCKIPVSTPLIDMLSRFGFRSVFTTQVETLYLLSNQLKGLDKDHFLGFDGVQKLAVVDSQIETIHSDSFLKLGNLTLLELYNNSINSLPEGLFRANGKLEFVTLAFNNIPTLPQDLFANLPGLHDIYFCCSGIEIVPGTVFANSSAIHIIFLSGNRISVLAPETFHGLTQLEYLDLNSNRVAELPKELFSSCHQLRYLDLSNNFIEDLPV